MPSSCEALRFSGRCFSLYSFIGMNRLPVPLFAIIAVPSPARPASVVRRPLSIFPDGGVLAALVDVLLVALADIALAAVADGWLLPAAIADVAPVLAVLLPADVLLLVLAALPADVLAAGRRSE